MAKNSILFTILILLLSGLFSCKKTDLENINKKENNLKHTLDSVIYNNYVNAIENESTLEYFVVIKIKNINNGNIREICTKGNFLSGAIHAEYKIGFEIKDQLKVREILIRNKQRYFELKDTLALNNLGLNEYTTEELLEFEKKNNFDSIVKSIKNSKWTKSFPEDNTMRIYAHLLFNRGILTGENSCFGGNLIYIDKKMLEEENKYIERININSKKK